MTTIKKINNFKQLIGPFHSAEEEQTYKILEKKFHHKKKYTERDWLTQNRQEVPQPFPEYERTQLNNRRMPRVKYIKIVQLWTE